MLLFRCFAPHVSIENSHKVGSKISYRGSIHGCHFFDCRQCILFGKHLEFRLDLFVFRDFLMRTKATLDEFLKALVHRRRDFVSHRDRRTPRMEGAFLNAHVTLDDTKEVGSVVSNSGSLELYGVIVFLKGVVDEIDVSEASEGF